jgi:hypothetical protein
MSVAFFSIELRAFLLFASGTSPSYITNTGSIFLAFSMIIAFLVTSYFITQFTHMILNLTNSKT